MRKDVTEDWSVIADILDRAETLYLGLPAAGEETAPYVVPVNFARVDKQIFIHSSRKGRKAAGLRDGRNGVGFSTVAQTEAKTGDKACKFGYRFQSVIGSGPAAEITDEAERKAALDTIAVKYGAGGLPIDQAVLEQTALFRLDVAQATARIKA